MSNRERAIPWFGEHKPYGLLEQLAEQDNVTYVCNWEDLLDLNNKRVAFRELRIPLEIRYYQRQEEKRVMLRGFRYWLYRRRIAIRRWWYALAGGCELCGEKKNLKFYDMGRWCYPCYRRWMIEVQSPHLFKDTLLRGL